MPPHPSHPSFPSAEPQPPLASALGKAARRLREARRTSQEAFADAIGVHRTAMSAFERGVIDPKLGTIEKVARGLGLAPSDLLRAAERTRTSDPDEAA